MRTSVLIAVPLTLSTASAATPDVAGFRREFQRSRRMRALKQYAGPTRVIKNAYMNLPDLSAKPVIHELDMTDGDIDNSAEVIEIHFTLPPGPQTVWRVVRKLKFQPGKELLPQVVVASLREKYGPEAQLPMASNIDGMWWFTADGQRASLPLGVGQFANCSSVGPKQRSTKGSANPGILRYDLIQPLQPLGSGARTLPSTHQGICAYGYAWRVGQSIDGGGGGSCAREALAPGNFRGACSGAKQARERGVGTCAEQKKPSL